MQLVSVYLHCYIDKYALEIRQKNEILNLEFNLRMGNVSMSNNFDSWVTGGKVNVFIEALEVFGRLAPAYLKLITPKDKELSEDEVRLILNLPNNIYNMPFDNFIVL